MTQPKATQPGAFAITSLVTGIIALLMGWNFLGLVVGIIAVIFGILALRQAQSKGFAISGIVTGSIGALSGIFFSVVFAIAILVGGIALNEINQEVSQGQVDGPSYVDQQKAYPRGETATFASLTVTANGVTRNYQPQDDYLQEDGQEFVVVNLTIKNATDQPITVYKYDFGLAYGDKMTTPVYVDAAPALPVGNLAPHQTITGNLVFMIPEGTDGLHLTYVTYENDQKLEYRLAL